MSPSRYVLFFRPAPNNEGDATRCPWAPNDRYLLMVANSALVDSVCMHADLLKALHGFSVLHDAQIQLSI